MTDRLQATLSMSDVDSLLHVHAVRGEEEVSRPFRYEVDFSAEALDVNGLPGALAQLVIQAPRGGERCILGAVEELALSAFGATDSGGTYRYRAVLRPSSYVTLSLRSDHRIFQKKSAVEVVQQIWKDAGLDAKLLSTAGLSGSYLPRDFCVQYGESQWDFLCRLLEDEGIFFAFKAQSGDSDATLTLEDDSSAVDLVDPDSMPFAYSPGTDGDQARIWEVEMARQLGVTKVEVNDYDLLRPSTQLNATATAKDAVERGFYEHPAGYTDAGEGKRRAKVRLAELRAKSQVLHGMTDALFLVPGRRFKLTGHPTDEGGYFVQRVGLDARVEEETGGHPLVERAKMGLDLTFSALPEAQLFRPARATPWAPFPGLQTALVCGPPGEEIHCDEHGRVKLQFAWDREAKADDKVSTWIRVAQPHTTGAFLLPRVGWEVLVEFEDGDPDRPICLGKVWNPVSQPPVALPGGKAQMGHSSQSSPGGNGKNEVTFDDSAGSEKVRISSAKDILVKAANDKVLSVGKAHAHTVNKKRTSQVKGNEDIAVGSDQDVRMGASETVTVGATHQLTISGSANEEVKGAVTRSVSGMEMIKVGSATAALLSMLKEKALAAATGAAANAASSAQAALLGPIMPALGKAKAALGSASEFAGSAGPLLGKGAPQIDAITKAAAAMDQAQGAAAAEAGAMATSVANQAMGGGGGGGGAGPAGPTAGTAGGEGTWKTTVVGEVTEKVGGLAATNSLAGVTLTVNGDSKETVGAARIELIKGGKTEATGGNKLEGVGVYMINAKESLTVSGKVALALNIAGLEKQKVTGTHTIAAEGPLVVNAPTLKLNGGETITLTVGSCKVVINSSGISIDGASTATIDASKIELNESPLGA